MTSLPAVASRTHFRLHEDSLSTFVFGHPLTPEQSNALEQVTHDFYSQSPGGSRRAMIVVEIDGDMAHFRAVHGRELPTKQLFDQLLLRLSEELSLIDVNASDSIAPRAATQPEPSAPQFYDHTRRKSPGFVPRSQWSHFRK